MPAQIIKGARISASNDNAVFTDTSINIGSTTGPVSFFVLAVANGGASTTSIDSITINGTAMTLEADRSLNVDFGVAGRWRPGRLDGVTISGALTIVVTKSAAFGRTNLVVLWSDQSTGVTNVAHVPYANGGTTTYAFSATVPSSAASQAAFVGLFNASVSVTPTAPTVFPQHEAADAIGLLVGSTEIRLGGLAEPGATSSVLQASLTHAFSAGAIGWVASFSGTGGAGPTISGQPSPQIVTEGAVANFAVTAAASGGGTLAYQWRKDGVNISGATLASYARTTVLGDNGSQISVLVTEAGGSNPGSISSSNALLTVNSASSTAPSISVQPAPSSTIIAGSTVTLSVTTSGSAPLAYQWRKNGSNIGGATNASYTSPPLGTLDTGSIYTVLVSNGVLPNATSNNAVVTVNGAPVVAGAVIAGPFFNNTLGERWRSIGVSWSWWTGANQRVGGLTGSPAQGVGTLSAEGMLTPGVTGEGVLMVAILRTDATDDDVAYQAF